MERGGLGCRWNRPRQVMEQRPGLKLGQARVLAAAEAGRWRGPTDARTDVFCRIAQLERAGKDSVQETRAVRVQLESWWTGGLTEGDRGLRTRKKVRDLA